jgi:hypothetical protein
MNNNTLLYLSFLAFTVIVFASCENDKDSKVRFSKASLIAYYPFDGNAHDLSDNAYHGFIHGAVPAPGRNNERNGAYLFNGYNNYIQLPSYVALNTDRCFSIEAWICNDSVTTDGKYNDNAIFGQTDGRLGSDYPIILLEIKNDNSVRAAIRGIDNPPLNVVSETKIEDNQWYHIVMVRDSHTNDLAVYINGELANKSDLQITGNTVSNDFVAIGGYFDDLLAVYHFFCGRIDLVRIWNISLTEKEIVHLMTDNYSIE